MVVSEDMEPWGSFRLWGLDQAPGRALMDRWMSFYPADKWKKSGTSWECSGTEPGACAWAGVDYEQGSFKQLLEDDQVHRIPWSELQSPFTQKHPDSTAFHFAGHYKQKEMPQYLELQRR